MNDRRTCWWPNRRFHGRKHDKINGFVGQPVRPNLFKDVRMDMSKKDQLLSLLGGMVILGVTLLIDYMTEIRFSFIIIAVFCLYMAIVMTFKLLRRQEK